MPTIRPTHVASFSSEDPYHPAANLLKGDTFRKWKCKEPGEKEAYVILKLDKAVQISAIDIGNEYSAFVEVMVARSGDDALPKFQTLLSKSALMSPSESRDGNHQNRVRMFGADAFSKDIAAQKWDLVKVVCCQEFNTHVQFGLAFITLKSPTDTTEKPSIGGFKIRAPIGDEDGPDEDLTGKLFSKKAMGKGAANGTPITPKTAAASIQSASNALLNAANTSSEERVKELKKQKLLDHEEDIPVGKGPPKKPDAAPVTSRNSSWYGSPPRSTQGSEKEVDTQTATNSTSQSSISTPVAKSSTPKPSSQSASVPKPASKKQPKKKPFDKLLDDVVFVMSGYENPYRTELRRKACNMGAKCVNTWGRSCTHLICAFVNTPKFREVRQSGHGKIVKNDWIELSYRDRKRYPWRKFALDRDDRDEESEEEILAEDYDGELIDSDTEDAPPARQTTIPKVTNGFGNGETEDDVKPASPKKRKRAMLLESDDEDETPTPAKVTAVAVESEEPTENGSNASTPSDPYDADTDVEDNPASPSLMDSDKPNAIFEGTGFQFASNIPEDLRTRATETIASLGGIVLESHTKEVEFILTAGEEWEEEFSEALADDPNVTVVRTDWIFDCERDQERISEDSYTLLPN